MTYEEAQEEFQRVQAFFSAVKDQDDRYKPIAWRYFQEGLTPMQIRMSFSAAKASMDGLYLDQDLSSVCEQMIQPQRLFVRDILIEAVREAERCIEILRDDDGA